MKGKYSIFDFFARVMMIYGFLTVVLNIFCVVFGDSAHGFSSIFASGSQGISVQTSFQFLAVSILIEAAKLLFFSDILIRKMDLWLRTVCLQGSILLIIIIFIILFGWFPINMWKPWVLFFICFGISFAVSTFLMQLKEKTENRKLNNALEKLKRTEKQDHEI